MKIELKKFGRVLTSRPAGKNSLAAFQPTLATLEEAEEVVVVFSGIGSLSPSWADEFLTPLQNKYRERLVLEKSDNPSVELTLEMLEEINDFSFRRSE